MTSESTKFALALTAAIGLLLTGCTVGPDYERPETPADTAGSYNAVPAEWHDPNQLPEPVTWWQNFGDPVTEKLVRLALEENYDLKSAAARVIESQAILRQAHGARWPQISYNADRLRAKRSLNTFGFGGSILTTDYSQDINITYIADIFGRLRRAEQAAYADLLSTTHAHYSLAHAIIAQVIRTRVQIATNQRLLDIARANTANWQRNLEIINRRYESGLVTPLDVRLARENLASSKAAEPSIQQALQLQYHSLDVLLGRPAGTTEELTKTLDDLPDLSPVPLGLPIDLLEQRPDVRQAEMQVAAATERVGVNIAQMLPDFTLTGSFGYNSSSFRQLTEAQNQVYSGIISLAAPIFQGGQLVAGVDAAKARVEQAAANYSGTILTAIKEVEDALVTLKNQRTRIAELRTQLDEALKAEELAGQRYVSGVDNILLVLETERRRRQAENQFALAKGNLWQARIDLHLALGGDWQITEIIDPVANKETGKGN
ncbi:Toluene efflux pump outer membrane protein TtgF precursor [Anaerohalosphaera lusitana]|uniref:Toluene efflux pump outer membrane protein TtgF n=1 Tax=Anaerohalosphaera lusitana TaxID=1936003 RepID=A0A1U9NPY9_9BACT|nr:efflux transporter outer membrane subunit [Anaerohalosphaera lusitana]AQT70003.1 Toluene efflux pump outer membrane protein TtgF precursor [Anaerohalosphaera lusitana]